MSWYDRVYLCVEKKPTWAIKNSVAVSGFECNLFDSLVAAEEFRRTTYSEHRRSAILPICSFVPNMLDTAVLGTKLKNRFNMGSGTPCHVRIVEQQVITKST
jgi:hypothetical protein